MSRTYHFTTALFGPDGVLTVARFERTTSLLKPAKGKAGRITKLEVWTAKKAKRARRKTGRRP